jgi:uncharacterized protein YjbJ (UPF0337 family)
MRTDWNRVEGNWKQVKGKVKEQWGKLTDDDLDVINGKQDQLRVGCNSVYGYAKDEAKKEVNDWYGRQKWRDRSWRRSRWTLTPHSVRVFYYQRRGPRVRARTILARTIAIRGTSVEIPRIMATRSLMSKLAFCAGRRCGWATPQHPEKRLTGEAAQNWNGATETDVLPSGDC